MKWEINVYEYANMHSYRIDADDYGDIDTYRVEY